MRESRHLSISVAMGTRNGAHFLRQQLESILAQSLPPHEIVISDDDSTDETPAIIQEIARTHPEVPFTFLRNSPALGISANFQRAVLATTGDFVALSDQDDVWRKDRLALMGQRFAENDSLIFLASNARLIDEFGAPLGSSLFEALEVTSTELDDLHSGRAFSRLLRRNLVTGATSVFRRTVLERAVPFPPNWVHDEWIAIVAATLGIVDVVEDELVDYRQHHANAIGAARATLRVKVSKLIAPRTERNHRLAARAQELAARLQENPDLPDGLLEAALGKLGHEQMREALPASRIGRVAPVMRAVARGDYSTYSRGKRDVLRDLVQPA